MVAKVKVVRFEIEYESGQISRLVGDDAHEHLERIDAVLGLAQARNPGCLDHWRQLNWIEEFRAPYDPPFDTSDGELERQRTESSVSEERSHEE